jgi:hypothetical protein
MSRRSSAQVHVLLIRNADNKTWVVGTPSQRGFTEAGLQKAKAQLEPKIPATWSLLELEITPIDEVW